jgi:enoyl-[acyl-carrier protein] reductase II
MKQFGILNKEGDIENELTRLFGIKYPLIQAGMIWASGWELASAVSNAGGLGIIGAGSMYPHILDEHIIKCKEATQKPFAVNLPLLYPDIDQHVHTIIKHKVPIVFTSAGNPNTWTSLLKENGCTVVHVVSSSKFALKSQEAGVDAVVAEGFEAGGHNGREETTTLCLIPAVAEKLSIPVIAAGGIYSGNSMLSAMILGASGVQVGSRFVCSHEASSHINFKNEVVQRQEGETELVLKSLAPVRLIKNEFYKKVKEAEMRGAPADELKEILGRARAKLGMFEGNLQEGELEIGQVSGQIHDILPAADIVHNILTEFKQSLGSLFALAQGKT